MSNQVYARIHWHQGCHSQFPEEILPHSVRLIVYNLGYLPSGGNKKITTQKSTTLKSLEKALVLLQPGGVISITCYPGHAEGAQEMEEVIAFAAKLPPSEWSCCLHHWLNRNKAPALLLIQKSKADHSTVA